MYYCLQMSRGKYQHRWCTLLELCEWMNGVRQIWVENKKMSQKVKNEWKKNGDFHFSSHKISCQCGKLGLWQVLEERSVSSQKYKRQPLGNTPWTSDQTAGQSPSQGESVTQCSTRWKVTRPLTCDIQYMSCCCSWCISFVRFVYLRQLLQPQLHPLQDKVGVTGGCFGVFPLVFESAANTTCITTQTQRSEGSRYFLSHFWMCLVLLPQFTLSHDTTVFNGAIIIHFMCGDARRDTVWREFIWQVFSWSAFRKTRTYLKHKFLQQFVEILTLFLLLYFAQT